MQVIRRARSLPARAHRITPMLTPRTTAVMRGGWLERGWRQSLFSMGWRALLCQLRARHGTTRLSCRRRVQQTLGRRAANAYSITDMCGNPVVLRRHYNISCSYGPWHFRTLFGFRRSGLSIGGVGREVAWWVGGGLVSIWDPVAGVRDTALLLAIPEIVRPPGT